MAPVVKKLALIHFLNQEREPLRDGNKLAEWLEVYKKRYGYSKKAKDKIVADTTLDNLPSKRKACGLYLLQVAKIYEAMELEPDMMLVRSHLNGEPSFHPRRTLDQSYYFKLDNTDSRDEDQVVYRGTKAERKIHGNTRVIMVDQLWLYILDDCECHKWDVVL